jgi:hypothetical protein
VKEDGRLSSRRTTALPIKPVAVADVQHARVIRLDFRIEGAALGHHILRTEKGRRLP